MKKILFLVATFAFVSFTNAQESVDSASAAKVVKKRKSNGNSSNNSSTPLFVSHPADHLLIQFGSDSWTNKPNSINTNGGKHFNIYLMTEKPFKTNPKFSVAYGLGIGSSNIYFNNTTINIGSDSGKLTFNDATGKEHFKKYKLTEIFLEAPVEIRYTFNPDNPNKSWKIALGAKVGTLLKAFTKGKDLLKADGTSIYGPTFIRKEYSKKLLNTTRLSFTGRVGYGNFTLNASYSITPVIKSGFGAELNTMSVGVCIGGL